MGVKHVLGDAARGSLVRSPMPNESGRHIGKRSRRGEVLSGSGPERARRTSTHPAPGARRLLGAFGRCDLIRV